MEPNQQKKNMCPNPCLDYKLTHDPRWWNFDHNLSMIYTDLLKSKIVAEEVKIHLHIPG